MGEAHDAEEDANDGEAGVERALAELAGETLVRVAVAHVDAREVEDREQRGAQKLPRDRLVHRHLRVLLRRPVERTH